MPISMSLVITIKSKAVHKFHAFAMFLFCEIIISMKVIQVSNMYYHTKFQVAALSDTIVTPTAQVCMATMLVLLMVGNKVTR
jgi:hypothetical protein